MPVTARKLYAYSPFLKFLGGGEKYFANILAMLQERMSVILICEERDMAYVSRLPELFNIDLSHISTLVVKPGLRSEGHLRELVEPESLFLQISNEVPLLVNCRKKYLHQQTIFSERDAAKIAADVGKEYKEICSEIRDRYLAQDHIFFPSKFISRFMIDHWSLDPEKCTELHPFVSDTFINSPDVVMREPKIISVGRYEPIKKQMAQVEHFKKILPFLPVGTRLVLIGSNRTPLSNHLERLADKYPISLRYSLSEHELLNEYSTASLFWSTTGLDVKNVYEPHNVESFGLAMAEAMASGCVPIAINAGGVSEIIDSGTNGYLVSNIEELGELSIKLLSSPELLRDSSIKARNRATVFSRQVFQEKLVTLFESGFS